MYDGIIPPETYNALFTMHATIMIFFAVMPILVGCFGNFLIPLMIGARDMAFPLLNMLSFWVGAVAGIIMLAELLRRGRRTPRRAGPRTRRSRAVPAYTGVDWGQNLWCISLIVLGVSSLMGSINYITTIINMRAPGMTWFRLPLTIWALFITAILLLLALPVLTAALGMLLFDRMAGTQLLPARGRRRAAPLAAPVLVLRPPRGLHPDPARHGHRLRHPVRSSRASRSSATARWCSR